MAKPNSSPSLLSQPGVQRILQGALRRILYVILFWLALWLGWSQLPARIELEIVERYAIQNNAAAPVKLRLAALLPRSGPYQEVEVSSIQAAWAEYFSNQRQGDLDVVRIQATLPASAQVEAQIHYRVRMFQGLARWQGPVSDWQRQPQSLIEADDPDIIAQSQTIVNDMDEEQRQSEAAAYRMFQFTANYLAWPRGQRINVEPSAATAYLEQIGGCSEFSNLLVALLRAGGIPAQSVVGLALPPLLLPYQTQTSEWNHPAGAHAWTEFYAPEHGWELADASWASQQPLLRSQWFGRTDGSHLAYGEMAAYDNTYAQITDWVKQDGQINAAMSAPLHFAAGSDSADVTLTPRVELRKTWDGRWANTALLVALCLAAVFIFEKWLFKRLLPRPQ